MRVRAIVFALASAFLTASALASLADNDPYFWLSDIHGTRPLAWVKAQNARSDAALKSDPRYADDYAAILKSLDVPDRLPLGRIDHGLVYNFWQDTAHVRGVWRRTTVADYRSATPHWETLLDVDKLDTEEHAQFVWQGADCATDSDLCLIRLSPGGGDATTIREFDLKTKSFVKDGFALPLAKLDATYLDKDTILFGTDFGPGTMTKSSYPRLVKLWHRGTAIADAKTIFEAEAGDVSARPVVFHNPNATYALIERGLTFFTSESYQVSWDGTTTKLPLPPGAVLHGTTNGALIFTLRDAWTPPGGAAIPQGSLVAYRPAGEEMVVSSEGKSPPSQPTPVPASFTTLYTPGAHDTIDSVRTGRDAVYASIFHDVMGSVHAFHTDGAAWHDTKLDLPSGGLDRGGGDRRLGAGRALHL